MDPSSTALQGLQQAEVQLETAASRIAKAGAISPNGSNMDVVDLSPEIVTLMSAQTLFESNLATLETADQIEKALIDIKA